MKKGLRVASYVTLILACSSCDGAKDQEIEVLKAERDRLNNQMADLRARTAAAIPMSTLSVVVQMQCGDASSEPIGQLPRMAIDGRLFGPNSSIRLINQALEPPRQGRLPSGEQLIEFDLVPSASNNLDPVSLADIDSISTLSIRLDAMLAHVGVTTSSCLVRGIEMSVNGFKERSRRGSSLVSETDAMGYRNIQVGGITNGLSQRFIQSRVEKR